MRVYKLKFCPEIIYIVRNQMATKSENKDAARVIPIS